MSGCNWWSLLGLPLKFTPFLVPTLARDPSSPLAKEADDQWTNTWKKITANTTISSRALFIYCNLITEMQMHGYNKEWEKCHEERLQKNTRPHVKVDHQIHIIQLRFTLSNKKKKTKTNWVQWNHDLPIRNFFALNSKCPVQCAARISTCKILQESTIRWK